MNKCDNYQLCNNSIDNPTGLCEKCNVFYGKLTFTNIVDECFICITDKTLVKLCCDKHYMCIDCWDTLCKVWWANYKPGEKRGAPKCPFCRQSIWS